MKRTQAGTGVTIDRRLLIMDVPKEIGCTILPLKCLKQFHMHI